MQNQKSQIATPHGGGWLSGELKLLFIFFGLIFSFNFIAANNVSALFVPTLSASVDQANLQVNGNQVINSTNKTTEIPLNLTVNTNNKTGYTASLNSETDETALVNNDSSNGAKINSISSAGLLGDFSNNTWGFKFGNNLSYLPIPALSIPSQIIQTTTKTSGNESSRLTLGLKLSDNLESGNYTNKIILSFVSNPYQMQAIMTEGPDFNAKLKSLETSTNKIERFKKNTIAPSASMNVVNIDDEESDYEIKLWLDPTDKTAYYYAEPEKVYLNVDSSLMFYPGDDGQKIKNILEIDPSNFDTSNVTNMHAMFYGMSNLTNLNLSNFDTSKVTDMAGMFANMPNLVTLNLSSFDTSKVIVMNSMFYNMSKLTALDLSNFNTPQVTDMNHMFYNTSNLTALNLSSFDTSKVKNMTHMFHEMSKLTTLNLSNFDTSQVTDMSYMFDDMFNLTTLNLSSFNTSNVTNMYAMFQGVRSLTILDLSNFDTSKVAYMGYMFYDMSNITTLNLSSFDTSQVTDMGGMFAYMPKLNTLNLSNFNTSRVTNMYSMFSGMSNLAALNLSNFDTSKVTNMGGMFYNMSNLTTLDISNFNTSQVTDMNTMFFLRDEDKLMDKLEKIYVNNDFDTAKSTNFSEMFRNRKTLRGGNGSFLADPSTADKTWLRVDRPGVHGYFIRKP